MNPRHPRPPLTAVLLALGGLVLAATQAPQASTTPQPSTPAKATAAKTPGQAHQGTSPHARRVTVGFRTVPAVAGVRIAFGGHVVTTDAAGRASYTAAHTLTPQMLRLLDTAVDTAGRHYRFTRWVGQRDPDQAFRPVVRGLPLRADYTVTAAFTVLYPVTAGFTDQHGSPLDLTHISKATVKSSTGRLTDLNVGGTTWLDGAFPVYRGSRVDETPVTYSLQSLVYDGAQLADAGRQRFSPSTPGTVTFTGPFHDLRITAHDAVFGGRTGQRAEVTGPDGKVRTVRFGAHRTAVLTHLPRGSYLVTVKAPGGLVADQEVRLSGSRTVDAPVITPLDMLFVGLPLLALAGAVVVIRRTRRSPQKPELRPLRPGPLAGDDVFARSWPP
ncbi:hypothetical protein [Streptomyces sp. NPDC001401]|uniref:hypothetical protein n=1 Tax=Streptomyces sp. NPDC001401 TaxID=3364570 RepID=UPI0036C4B035